MSDIEGFAKKESEFGFYGYTVEEVVTEVKGCLEEIIEGAIEDSKKKLLPKVGSINEAYFEEVKKNYIEAIENHKDQMETLITDAFRVVDTDSEQGIKSNESSLEIEMNQEIEYLQKRAAALDIYMTELMKVRAEVRATADIDTSKIQYEVAKTDEPLTQLSNDLHRVVEMFYQPNQCTNLEKSFGDIRL